MINTVDCVVVGAGVVGLAVARALALQGGAGDDRFLVGDTAITVTIDGGAGRDTLLGTASQAAWRITGQDAGEVARVRFSGVETLQGAADNEDVFSFDAAGWR